MNQFQKKGGGASVALRRRRGVLQRSLLALPICPAPFQLLGACKNERGRESNMCNILLVTCIVLSSLSAASPAPLGEFAGFGSSVSARRLAGARLKRASPALLSDAHHSDCAQGCVCICPGVSYDIARIYLLRLNVPAGTRRRRSSLLFRWARTTLSLTS